MTIAQRLAVTDTSAQVYREEAVMVGLRERTVLGWLTSMGVVTDPTSAELAILFRLSPQMADFDGPTARALFVRRGLSGLKALGKVEHGEPRICTVSHRRCETWRTTSDMASVLPVANGYESFLSGKRRVWSGLGHTVDVTLSPVLHEWQAAITRWALRKGRAALFCDTGLGKTFMQVSWANALNVPTLFFAPLCVAEQTVEEAAKLGVTIVYARNQAEAGGARLVITNYERIDDFEVSHFGAVVLDESSILKAFTSKTRAALTEACARVRYRLCCTATPSPNDIAELGNHAEFLGLMTRSEFLATWFVHDDAGWRMKKHARQSFYRWLASWAIAIRLPSDIGYADDGYVLPKLQVFDHVVTVDGPSGNTLFPELSTKGLTGRLDARRGSLSERVEKAIAIMQGKPQCQWLVWCGLNDEADAIAAAIDGAVNVQGSDSYEAKSRAVKAFVAGETRVLVSKVRVLGFGMNFQNCHHMLFVGMNDSFEQFYQAVRRCWRFGQKHPVDAHVIVSEAEQVVVENVRRKEAAARDLSRELVSHMADFEREELSFG